jgi:hypothetical protein
MKEQADLPPEKLLPLPLSTTTRAGEAAASVNARCSSSMTAPLNTFRTSGRFRRTCSTAPCGATSIVW